MKPIGLMPSSFALSSDISSTAAAPSVSGEAFAAQVLSNIQWIGSKKIAKEKLGRSEPIGEIDPTAINRTGGSIALGHPFGATGARIVTTVCNELQRTGQQYGLVTVCAAGGIGVAMVLERE